MEHIGQRIKDLRKKADLTQDRLADYLGVSAQAVSKWECGISAPELSMIVPLTGIFGVTADELLGCGGGTEGQEACEESLSFIHDPENIDPAVLYPKCLRALEEYPRSMWVRYHLATAEEGLAVRERDPGRREARYGEAERLYRFVLAETADEVIRSCVLNRLALLLMTLGRQEEAEAFARQCSNADFLLQYCLTGEERVMHMQEQARMKLVDFLSVFDRFNREGEDLSLLRMQESILRAVFPDGNYLYFTNWLIPILRREAVLLARAGDLDGAVEKLGEYCAAEEERARIMEAEGPIPYTNPLFNRLSWSGGAPLILSDCPLSVRVSSSLMGEGLFEALRGREDYLTLLEQYIPGIRERMRASSAVSASD